MLASGAACASGGAPVGQLIVLLIGALVTGLGGMMASGCGAQKSAVSGDSGTDTITADITPDSAGDTTLDMTVDTPADTGGGDAPPTSFVCSEGSLPPGAPGTAGWVQCCIRNQTRACPPPPPLTACNYGWDTFCPDGTTCGPNFMDPCGTGKTDGGSPDAPADMATDMVPVPDAPTDVTTDAFAGCGVGSRPADGGMPDGWQRCCMSGESSWCPPSPPTVACNYGQVPFCADGITCGFQACGVVDSGSAEVMP